MPEKTKLFLINSLELNIKIKLRWTPIKSFKAVFNLLLSKTV